MMTFIRKTFLLICLVVLIGQVSPLMAQIRVSASIEQNPVGQQQLINYTITVVGASSREIRRPTAPNVTGLERIRNYPSTSQRTSFVNGKMSQSISFSWLYRPTQAGDLTIPAAIVKIQDQDYQTNSIPLKVVPQTQQEAQQQQAQQRQARNNPFGVRRQQRQAQPTEIKSGDVFIRALPSATSGVENEQISISYILYYRDGIRLNESRQADSWDADGFWREDLEVSRNPIPRTRIINGVRFNEIVLKRVAVFPIRTGNLTVDPFKVNTNALAAPANQDPFQSLFSPFNARFQPLSLASEPVVIDISPLPADKPTSFNGAVGKYRMEAFVNQTSVRAGDPITLRVTITGDGNLATLKPPVITVPARVDMYDPEINENITRAGGKVSGSKTFTYLLVPQTAGKYTLPAINFSYFNPTSNVFETSSSVAWDLTVAPGLPGMRTASNGQELRPLMGGGGTWISTAAVPVYKNIWAYLGFLFPFVAIAGIFGVRRWQNVLATNKGFARSRRASPLAKKHLKQAEKLLAEDNPVAFYEEISRAVNGFIGNRFNVAELGMTYDQLDGYLAEQNISLYLREELAALLSEADRARYAPVRPLHSEMETATERAATIITDLDQAATAISDLKS